MQDNASCPLEPTLSRAEGCGSRRATPMHSMVPRPVTELVCLLTPTNMGRYVNHDPRPEKSAKGHYGVVSPATNTGFRLSFRVSPTHPTRPGSPFPVLVGSSPHGVGLGRYLGRLHFIQKRPLQTLSETIANVA